MNNVIQFPAVGTWRYNTERLHRYAGSLMKQERWKEFECVMAIQELYDHDLVDIDWEPQSGEPIVVRKINDEAEESE